MHVHRVQVRFGDCDPAGIVYFPRFFDFFHQAMETWFSAIGFRYDEVILDRKIGFPAVHTEADFRAPSRFGEAIDVELRVRALGRSSVRFGYTVYGPERVTGEDGEDGQAAQPRLTGATVCVVMDLDPQSPRHRQAMPVPDDLRAAIEAFGVAGP